jgi:hypothetical protein
MDILRAPAGALKFQGKACLFSACLIDTANIIPITSQAPIYDSYSIQKGRAQRRERSFDCRQFACRFAEWMCWRSPIRAHSGKCSLTCTIPAIFPPLLTVASSSTPDWAPINTNSPTTAEPRDTALRDNHAVPAHDDIAPNLHKIVDLRIGRAH